MDRLVATGSVAIGAADTAPVGGTAQYATSGVPGVTAATLWPAYQYNAIQEEIVGTIIAAGFTPDRTTNAQLLAAIKRLATGAAQAYSFQTPTTGFSITIAGTTSTLILDPAGTLATGTITMPATAGIADGQVVVVSTSQTITALTTSANTAQSIKNAPTTLTAGGAFAYMWRLANTTWYRVQ